MSFTDSTPTNEIRGDDGMTNIRSFGEARRLREAERLTAEATLALVDRFGRPGDYEEHLSTDDMRRYLVSQGYPEHICEAADNRWRGW